MDCSPDCVIDDLVVDAKDCNGDGNFFVVLDFFHAHTSDSFYVFGNGRAEGPFAYSQLPIQLGPYPGDCRTEYEFVVIDQKDPLCKAAYDLGKICCDPCEIKELNVDIVKCNGDSCITIVIDFAHSGTGGIGFDVFDRNGFIGFYRYSSLPLTIDCFPISGHDYEYIKVCDNDNPHCCAEAEVKAIDCGEDCEIRDLVVKPLDCTDKDSFIMSIDFIHEHECDDEFYVFVNGHLSGPYKYDLLPLHTGPYKGGCDTRFEVIVADSSCFECSDTTILEEPCCKDGCDLFDLELHVLDCDTNDQFAIIIDFEGVNTSDSFYIKGNGRSVGPLPYNGLPYTLGPLDGDCDTEYEIVIVDAEDEHCRLEKEIGKVCCGIPARSST